MVDMKISVEEQKERNSPSKLGSVSSRDIYPYGTEISLDGEALKKLGGVKGFSVKDTVKITAEGTVTRISVNSNGEGSSEAISIQIKKMAIINNGDDEEDMSEFMKNRKNKR